MARPTYLVQIVQRGVQYVAVDSAGNARAWGRRDAYKGSTPQELAEFLYHREEIVEAVAVKGNASVCVKLIDYHRSASESMAEAVASLDCDVIAVLNRHRSAACESNPLLAHCIERVLADLRRAKDELGQILVLARPAQNETTGS